MSRPAAQLQQSVRARLRAIQRRADGGSDTAFVLHVLGLFTDLLPGTCVCGESDGEHEPRGKCSVKRCPCRSPRSVLDVPVGVFLAEAPKVRL